MGNNGWLKFAVFSFIGLLVSGLLLFFTSNRNMDNMSNMNNMNSMNMNTNGMQNTTGMSNGMNMQTGNGMNMQTDMNVQSTITMNDVQQQLYMIRVQLNQMQRQLVYMYNNMQPKTTMSNSMSTMPSTQSGGYMTNPNNSYYYPQNTMGNTYP